MTILRLGILFSTSGDYGVLGRDCRDGAMIAIELVEPGTHTPNAAAVTKIAAFAAHSPAVTIAGAAHPRVPGRIEDRSVPLRLAAAVPRVTPGTGSNWSGVGGV